MEEAPIVHPKTSANERPLHLLTLSARTEPALFTLIELYAQRLEAEKQNVLPDLCHTANVGRAHLGHRLTLTGTDTEAITAKLRTSHSGKPSPGVVRGCCEGTERPKIAFLFTGQGSQYVGMGRRLYETSPTFARALNRCDSALRDHLDGSLLEVLYPPDGVDSPINETKFTQPALFALEYALSELWRSWGVQPTFVLGHSVGEYVAACVAGVFSVEDGLRLIAERARLMQAQPSGGRMAAVMAPLVKVQEILKPLAARVSIAAVNGPRQTVISGAGEDVRALLAEFSEAGFKHRELTVSHAFHSPLMNSVLEPFEQAAAKVSFDAPRLRLVSNLTGQVTSPGQIVQPNYWRRHIRETVQYAASMQTLAEAGCTVFLEIGPNPVLLGLGRSCIDPEGGLWLASMRAGRDDWDEMLASLSQLYVHGVEVDWVGFDHDYPRQKVNLPTYPFQRERYFVDRQTKRVERLESGQTLHPLAERFIESPSLKDIVFETRLSAASHRFVEDHRVFGRIIFPAIGYLESVRAAARLGLGDANWAVENILIGEALALDETETRRLQVVLSRTGDVGEVITRFQVFSAEPGLASSASSWRLHASGSLRSIADLSDPIPLDFQPLTHGADEIGAEAFYANYRRRGMDFGPRFRGVKQVWRHPGKALGSDRSAGCLGHRIGGIRRASGTVRCLPPGRRRSRPKRERRPDRKRHVYAVGCGVLPGLRARKGKTMEPGDGQISPLRITLRRSRRRFKWLDEQGRLIAEMRGMSFKRADSATLERATRRSIDQWLYQTTWESLQVAAAGGLTSLPKSQETGLEEAPDQAMIIARAAVIAKRPSSPGRRWLILADRRGKGQRVGQASGGPRRSLRIGLRARRHQRASQGDHRFGSEVTGGYGKAHPPSYFAGAKVPCTVSSIFGPSTLNPSASWMRPA